MKGKEITDTLTLQMGISKTKRSYRLELQDLQLQILEGPHKGESLPLGQDLVDIGRHEALCDLVLSDDPGASARHARLQVSLDSEGHNRFWLRDLKSRNGTHLAGRQIREAEIFPGDRFTVGNSTLVLTANDNNPTRSVEVHCFDDSGLLVGQSQEMRQIFSMMRRLARLDLPVLLLGETGTGKSSIAEAIHNQSGRGQTPLVYVNCGALSPTLIESSLFGHEAGAFTGAKQRHKGFFEQAHGGTLFLDEIGELPLELQPKLLDVIESGRIKRLGGTQALELDFRLITATHKDLAQEAKAGRFREDLFYRLSVISLVVPPLRERLEDIPLLVETMLERLAPELTPRLTPSAQHKLSAYAWPGNIRELHNVLARTFAFTDALLIDAHDIDLPQASAQTYATPPSTTPATATVDEGMLQIPYSFGQEATPLKDLLYAVERDLLLQALQRTDWHVQAAAQLLQINPSWLYKRIKKFKLQQGSD